MQNSVTEVAVYNTAIYVRLSKEDMVAAQSGRESNSITNQKQLILDYLKAFAPSVIVHFLLHSLLFVTFGDTKFAKTFQKE